MFELVLPVGCAELEIAEYFDQLRMQTVDPELVRDQLGRLLHLLPNVLRRLLDHLFDPTGMNPAIGYQALHRDPGDLAANRVETGEDDGFRCVIHHDVHARGMLEGTNVATFPADDPPLHVVTGERNDGDGDFG